MEKSVYDANDDGVVDESEATAAHATSHESGGSDEVSVSGGTPDAHKASHQDGGSDEIVATGLVGRINYVGRGDPTTNDFSQANLTTDETWNELDLSAIVPAGAVSVYIKVYMQDDAANTLLDFRKAGNSNARNTQKIRTQVANVGVDNNFIVDCDAARKIEYYGTNTAIDAIAIVVCGWFI